MFNKIRNLLLVFLLAIYVISFRNVNITKAESVKLSAGREISISSISGNLSNVNIKIEFTTPVNLDGTNNALLIGLLASDGTQLTDERFVASATNSNVFDSDNVSLIFENAPSTIGVKTGSTSYTYTVETKYFNAVNTTKQIAKIVVIGQKGTEITADIKITEVKYSIKFGNSEAVKYSYNAIINGPSGTNYTYDINGHQTVGSWTGNDSSTFVEGQVHATKDITYTASNTSTKVDHSWTNVSEVAATIETAGVKAHQECLCGAKRLNSTSTSLATSSDLEIPRIMPHTLTHHAFKAATCLADGNVEYYSCSHCDKLFSDSEAKTEITNVVIPKGHSLTKTSAVSATCTTDGNIEYYECSKCHKKFSDSNATTEVTNIVSPKAHKLNKVNGTPATCTTDGTMDYYKCSVCNKKFSDANGTVEVTNITIPKTHNLRKVAAKAASCTENGNIEYYECTICYKKFTDSAATNQVVSVVISKYHDLEKVEAKAATCTENGNIEYYKCIYCHRMFDDEIGTYEYLEDEVVDPKIAHNFDSTGKCTVCGKSNSSGISGLLASLGCSSSLSATSIVLVLGLSAVVLKKKKEQYE